MTWTEPKYCLSCKEPISMCQCAQTIRSTDDLVKSLKSKLSRSEELNRELVDAANKYVAERENVVPDVTLIRHTFKRLKEALARVKENK